MQNQDGRPDSPNRPNSINQSSLSAPAKGDSANSGGAFDSDATLVDFTPPPDVDATLVDFAQPHDPDATMVDLSAVPVKSMPAPRSGPRGPRSSGKVLALEIGDILGDRYEILQLLGEGGMGAVYKAMDRELDRPVALKLIRPELAANPSILARFKQELLLAQQVTHKNVIRIYDLGDADGVKFITMEFVEGDDLRAIIREHKKFSPEEAVEIIQQVCRALEAVHHVGVIHRDLKPQNIMRDKSGRMLLMDFGLARTFAGDGMTQTGALVGTMEYMSPEQALAKDLDQRSDLFTLGLILYELLTGVTPYQAESAVASLIKRNSERAVPVSHHDETIPGALSNIVSKCLERDPNLRYHNAGELLRDLDIWQGKIAAATLNFQPAVEPWGRTIHWPLVAGGAIVILAILAFVFRGPLFATKRLASGPALSLGILPFRNASGDPSLDWLGPSLADMLSTDVGQSASLHAVSQDRVHQVMSDLRLPPNSSLDPATLKRLAEFSNADTLVSGQYAKFGGQVRIDATLQDLKRSRTVPIKIEAVDEKDIPGAVDKLAAAIRDNLSFSSDMIQELKASSFQPSTRSADALRDYDQGVQFARDGKNLDAVKSFQSSVKEDGDFALAYSRLAEADSTLGYDSNAEQASRKAVQLSQSLPVAEKYLIEATHARVIKDNKKAIEAYQNLAKSMPENTDVESALGSLYTETANYDAARTQLTKLLAADPKNIRALWQMGVVEIVSGDPQAALDPLNKGLSLAVQVDAQELKALILNSMGIAYRLMHKPEEATRNYQDAMAINQRLGLKRALASNMVEMAIMQNLQGKPDAAIADYNQALQLQREIGMKKEVGDTLIDMGVVYQSKGNYDKALENYKESLQIQRDTGDENYQALCLNNIGGVYLGKGDSDNALTYLQQALQLRQKLNAPAGIAETLSALGEVYLGTGQYDQALTTSMQSLDLWRKAGNLRGAADESHDIGLVLESQGRFGAAVNSMQEALKGYRAVADRSADLVELLNDLADALAQAGRGAEAEPLLQEAQAVSRDLKNETTRAELLVTEGDIHRYRGEPASTLYVQALQAAQHGTDPNEILLCKLRAAQTALGGKDSNSSPRTFHDLMQQADSRNLKSVSLQASVDEAESQIAHKSYSEAQHQLESDLGRSEKMGARYLAARIQFLLGRTLRLSGNQLDASDHYRSALTSLGEMQKDSGAEKLLDRADLKTMFAEASQFAGAGK